MAGRNDPVLSTRVTHELRDAVRAAADGEGMSVGAWVTAACERALGGGRSAPSSAALVEAVRPEPPVAEPVPRAVLVETLGMTCRYPGCKFRGRPGEKCPTHGLES